MTGRMKSWSRWALWSTTRPWSRREKAQAKTPTGKELAEQAAEKAKQAAEPKEDELIITAE